MPVTMKSIIFDWSGVVRDTVTGQLWIINKIFEKYNVSKISMEEFRKNWKQPPDLFYQKYLPEGYSEEDRVNFFSVVQLDKDCPKSAPFSEVVKLIHKCKERGYFLAVVSSDFPETLLPEVREYELDNVFDEIVTGADNKLEAVQRIIKENDLDLQNTFFVGDSDHEIDVSRRTGIKSVAVTWGFTSEKELRAKNPDYVAHNAQELESVICAKIEE